MIKRRFQFKKVLCSFIMILYVLISLFGSHVPTANAAEVGVTKTAMLKDIKVSFNGAETVSIQAYEVDGVNYAVFCKIKIQQIALKSAAV